MYLNYAFHNLEIQLHWMRYSIRDNVLFTGHYRKIFQQDEKHTEAKGQRIGYYFLHDHCIALSGVAKSRSIGYSGKKGTKGSVVPRPGRGEGQYCILITLHALSVGAPSDHFVLGPAKAVSGPGTSSSSYSHSHSHSNRAPTAPEQKALTQGRTAIIHQTSKCLKAFLCSVSQMECWCVSSVK